MDVFEGGISCTNVYTSVKVIQFFYAYVYVCTRCVEELLLN